MLLKENVGEKHCSWSYIGLSFSNFLDQFKDFLRLIDLSCWDIKLFSFFQVYRLKLLSKVSWLSSHSHEQN